MTVNWDKLRTPQIIFIIYILGSSLLILIFRFIFPLSEAPLLIYMRSWRNIQSALEVFNWFPALAFSALVIPFGLVSFGDNNISFTEVFSKRLMSSVITAIAAAVVYALIFFLILPSLKNREENLRFSGELYQLAKKNAYENAASGDWYEASQFIDVCERIWHNNPDVAELKDRIAINLESYLFGESEDRTSARNALLRDRRNSDNFSSGNLLPDFAASRDAINATEAISMSRAALNERRFFDAHWLANLAMRLVPDGSAQEAAAARLASEAWNMISTQAPNRREERLFELHNIKLSGYNAMNADRWIEAFYIFQELLTLTPDDPDVRNFLNISEQNAVKIAFFIDEVDLSFGEILNGSLYSLPIEDGRTVLRFSTLTVSADLAYGIGLEYMKFDANNNITSSVISRYAKLLPFIVNDKPQVLILTHALDRRFEERGLKGEWLVGQETTGGILMDISFEDFLLVTNARRGLSNLQITELFSAPSKLLRAGYVPQIFQAEFLNRIGTASFFLPVAARGAAGRSSFPFRDSLYPARG